ncbi:GNAT family N-acetyltransferase [Dokdonella sp. MW10]|uniref:GNAT family N-acetyltransferase n=1 Tax=Dokdonella sp. MW10 TaxID=2992926 RepID=UPI003F80F153
MTATTLTTRAARTDDQAFLVEANAAMARETEGKALDADVLARGVAGVFADPRRGHYRVAERGGMRVGCLLVTTEWSDWRDGDWWWIQSVYVVPEARRTGVFRALHAELEDVARATRGIVGLRLYVEHANHAAQATYASLGMHDAGYRMLETLF